jgi:hypothetical protein
MLYGLYLGLTVSFDSYIQLSIIGLAGVLFILGSLLLIYGMYSFIKRHKGSNYA